jgi:CRP-like cAMP-binding protein/RsiW-degrading membrane proteinase PrsW (M82 family)
MILSYVMAVLIPLLFLYAVYVLEIYAVSRPRLVAASALWGLAAALIVYVAQSELQRRGVFNFRQIVLVIAPLLEESVKAVFLLYLSHRMILRYSADGIAYGFAVGIAFAIAENFHYLLQNPDDGQEMILSRVLATNLMHAFNTGIIGAVVGAGIHFHARVRLNRAVGALGIAATIHSVFNLLALDLGAGRLLVLASLAVGIGGTITLLLIMRAALKRTGDSIRAYLMNRYSPGEVAAVANPARVAQTLAQFERDIAPERARLAGEYLTLQAQCALMRRTLALNQRARYTASLHGELALLENRIDALQKGMGAYTLAWVRSLVPSEDSALWEQLGAQTGADQPVVALLRELHKRQASLSAEQIAQRIKVLKLADLFSGLHDEDLHDLALLMETRQHGVAEVVIAQGAADARLYCIDRGSVIESVIGVDGEETILTALKRGDTFGQIGMLTEGEHPSQFTSTDAVQLYALSRADFLTLVYAKPAVGVQMMRELAVDLGRNAALMSWMRESAHGRIGE